MRLQKFENNGLRCQSHWYFPISTSQRKFYAHAENCAVILRTSECDRDAASTRSSVLVDTGSPTRM